jgi:DnaK suppressor protein
MRVSYLCAQVNVARKPTSAQTGRKTRPAAKTAAVSSYPDKPELPASTGEARRLQTAGASRKGASRPADAKRNKAVERLAVAAPSDVAATKPEENNGQKPKRPKVPGKPKTHLSAQELAEFRQMLLDKRRELIGDVTNLETQAMRQTGAGGSGGSSSMPIHMADLGSDTWEQELTLGLIENERALLREIDEALDRIEDKTYGLCVATNKPISKSRLRAKPWAKYCIEYARKRELGLA